MDDWDIDFDDQDLDVIDAIEASLVQNDTKDDPKNKIPSRQLTIEHFNNAARGTSNTSRKVRMLLLLLQLLLLL